MASGLVGDVQALETRLDDIESNIAALKQSLTTLNAAIASFNETSASIRAMTDTLTVVRQGVADMQGNDANLSARIDVLEAAFKRLDLRLSQVEWALAPPTDPPTPRPE